MKHCLCLAIALVLTSSCASPPEPPPESPALAETKPPVPSGPLPSGIWSGDYGPNTSRREPITVELRWEGDTLTGLVRSGFRTMDLTKASFISDTGDIRMEFDAQGNNNQTVHYVVEGKVDGNTMSGTWKHDAANGDFQVTRK